MLPSEYTLNLDGLRTLARRGFQKIARGVSAAATAQAVTIAAPGAGKATHLVGLLASYSDASDQVLTVTITQDGAARTLTVNTKAQLVLTGIDLVADENTAVTIDAPAGASGVTSTVQALYYTDEL